MASIAAIPGISYEAVAENQTVDVSITQGASTKTTDAYSPNPIEIDVGDSVIWTNNDFTVHTAVSGTSAGGPTGLFGGDPGSIELILPGGTQNHTFTDGGEFPYYCALHPNMVGEVIVGETGISITVETDRATYEVEDDVTISGTVAPIRPGFTVLIQIVSEEGDLARIDVVGVDSSGFYTYIFPVGGPLFSEDLSYSVIANYAGTSAETSFFISSSTTNGGTCQTLSPTILGTEEGDELVGTEGDDIIFGLGGDDDILGLSGNDKICGGPGIDAISGGDGDDRVSGGRGNDWLYGDDGNDMILGGTGYDHMFGGDGDDFLLGGRGNDVLKGGSGVDDLDGQEGDDIEDEGPADEDPGDTADIQVELDDIEYSPGDDVAIEGFVKDGEEGDLVSITIHKPDGGSDNVDTEVGNDDGDFESIYEISDNADDGIYMVEVEFQNEDAAFTFFLVNEEDDMVNVVTDRDEYEPGDNVLIEGEVEDLDLNVDEVEITVIGPDGDEILDQEQVQLDNDGAFSFEFDLDDELFGRFAIIVEYDGEAAGFFIFEVEVDGGNSSDVITATLSKTSFAQGDSVDVFGEIADDELEQGEEVFITVEDPDGEEIFEDSQEPTIDGSFDFDFTLEDDAPMGQYEVTLSYFAPDNNKVLAFSVTTGSTNGGTSSDRGFTAKINKVSFLAGESMTVTGIVPSIVEDEPVNIAIFAPDGTFTGVQAFPEPDSSKEYSAALSLPTWLEVEDDYRVVVGYDGRDVELEFDITSVS